MKQLLLSAKAVLGKTLGRFFYVLFHTRPALKRGALSLFLYAVPTAVAAAGPVSLSTFGTFWAFGLLMLFWGMGAERAATDWDPVFFLPHPRSFAFWHWHALEKKRFLAAIMALVSGVASVVFLEVLP